MSKKTFEPGIDDAIEVFEELNSDREIAHDIFIENTKIIIKSLESKVKTLDEQLVEMGDPEYNLKVDDLQEKMILPLLSPLLASTDYHKVKRFIESFDTFEKTNDEVKKPIEKKIEPFNF